MKKTVNMLYVRGDSATFEKVNPTLKNYYEMLNCDLIDIVKIQFGGKAYDVICDDEALLRQPPFSFSVISKEGYPMIAGNKWTTFQVDGHDPKWTRPQVDRHAPPFGQPPLHSDTIPL